MLTLGYDRLINTLFALFLAVRFVVQFCFWQFGVLAPTHHPDLFCIRDLQAEHESSSVFSIAWQVSYTSQVTGTGPSILQAEFEMQWRIKEADICDVAVPGSSRFVLLFSAFGFPCGRSP